MTVEGKGRKHCEQRRLTAEGPAANLNMAKAAEVVARGRDMVEMRRWRRDQGKDQPFTLVVLLISSESGYGWREYDGC